MATTYSTAPENRDISNNFLSLGECDLRQQRIDTFRESGPRKLTINKFGYRSTQNA